jgi:uncharacterized protein (TIRG00374 family)
MKNKNTSSLANRMVPGLLLGFMVILGLMLLGDIRQIGELVRRFNWIYFVVAIGFTLINYALRFAKWHFYLGQIGVRRLSIFQSLRLFIAGFPLAVTPGKVGEVFKAVWLMRQTGVPVARGTSVVVAERISDGMAVLILSVLGVVAYPQFWPGFLAVFIALFSVIVVSQIRPLATWFLDLGDKVKWLHRIARILREFYEGSFILFRPGSTVLAVFLGVISWLGEGIGFYFILMGLGLPPGEKTLAMAVFVLAFSTIVGAASTLPGGLGAAEASIAGLITLTLHQEPAFATTATVLIRLATLWLGVGLGLLVWLFSPDLFGIKQSAETTSQA